MLLSPFCHVVPSCANAGDLRGKNQAPSPFAPGSPQNVPPSSLIPPALPGHLSSPFPEKGQEGGRGGVIYRAWLSGVDKRSQHSRAFPRGPMGWAVSAFTPRVGHVGGEARPRQGAGLRPEPGLSGATCSPGLSWEALGGVGGLVAGDASREGPGGSCSFL